MPGFFLELFARIYSRVFFYPSLLFNYLNRCETRRWFDRVDNQVVLGALPLRTFLPDIYNENIGGVLTMNESFEIKHTMPTADEWRARNIIQRHLPTVDFFRAPTQENIQLGIDFINEIGLSGKSVYVHCKAGRGRSTTVVACYLMDKHGITPDEAVMRIRERRSHIRMCAEQMNAVRTYYRQNIQQN
ncbi:Phosphatidylglycerophosphatase and protein-tyrosine phosphatase 1-like isoform X1 [Oopsacas minuta]|uniref:Phosphatidylglycerophosphatase and protein-tyrosine phosphatase 1 n=1 Tax=Oopsacas minuta TaxID=111878 RepID=A0AAV7JMV4_9METZ|nr:Phosphatidylglycerophosphatase and protein-tyrosine phosphatase 1-like isoform X1 [Oopsacas minuta]